MLCLASASALGEEVTFRQVFAAGDKIVFKQSVNSQSNIIATANGQVLQQMKQDQSQLQSGTMTVDEVSADGKVTKATFVFGADCAMTMDGPMGKQSQPSSVAGKTITVTQKANSKELEFNPEVDQAGAMEITQMFRNDGSMMPAKPVAVGDEWKINADEMKNMIPPGANAEAGGSGKLLSVKTVNGRQVAEVEMKMSIVGDMGGMKMDTRIGGKGLVDVQTSRPVDVSLSGPMTVSGQQQGPGGQAINLDVKGTMSVTAAATITGTPVGAVDRPRAADPVFPGNPGENATPVGVFTDGKLTLSLPANGAPTIKLGDKTFAVGDTLWDGKTLNGTFSAGDQSFPFKAVFNGDTVAFESGSRKSSLKKEGGAKNPLDD
jgi:hypothetical protein